MKSVKSTVQQTDEEELLKILSEQAPVGVCIVQDGKFCYFNSNFPIAIGYTADELVGKDPLELIVPEDRERVKENEIEMLKGELLSPYQFRVIHKDGSIRWVMEAVRSVRYHGRRAVLGNYMEVTERKQMEDRLKESEQKYRLLFETSPDFITQIDREGRYLAANPAVAKSLGVPLEELVGKTIFEVQPKEVAQRRLGMMRKALDEWQPQIFEDERAGRYFHHIYIPTKISEQKEAVQAIARDITERREMEEALRQGEEKYRALFNSAVVGMVVLDAETMKVAMVNQAALNMFGFSSVDEAIVLNPMDFIVPKDRERALEITMKDLFEQGSQQAYEFRAVTKDGREIWISTTAARIMHEGRLEALISFTDITERKQAEEALRQSEERYRTILEEMEDAYSEVDLAGNLTFVNNSVCRDLGYSRKELIGMSYKGFTVGEDIESVFRVFNEVYRTGVPNRGFPWKTIRKDGSHGFAETSVSPLRNSKGEIIGFRSVGRDIAERKQAEEALQQSEEKHRALFDSSGIGMFVMDAETMKIVMCNQAAAKMFGFSSEEEAIGVNSLDFIHPEHRDKVLEITTKEMFEQDLRRTHEYRVVNKNGREGWASVTGARIMHEGRLAGLISITDITERKQAVEALRQSEERYRTILEEMEDSYFEVDLGGHLTFVNNSVCRNLGYSREELIGMSYKGFTVEEDIESVFRVFNEVYRTGVPNKGFPWKIIRKDGSHGFAETFVSLLRNDKGEVIEFRGVGRDITERKHAEEKLRQSEENYRALFDSSVIGTFVLDAETMKVVMGNQVAANVFGFSSVEEAIGVNPLDLISPEEQERVLELIMKELFEQDTRQTYDIQAVTKDGRRIWISGTGARIMHGGKLAGLISFTDITERKQTEEALRQSEENYRALFDNSVIGTIVLDAETMKVAMVNQAAAKMFGFSSTKEVLGIDPIVFIRPDDRERIFDIAVKALFEQDSRDVYELGAVTKDGREIWINATGARIMHKGRLGGLICFTDITEEKQQRERLMMTDRLASLGELAAGTAHELNNPLTSIVGFSQLLMEREVPDDIREDLKIINNEAQRAARVTKNLLTFARKHAPVKQRDQINNIIEDVLKLRTYEHKADGIEVERQLDPNLPKIMVDYFQMQQVFMNIIINAEYFMVKEHNKGTLTITTKKQNNTVMISIADDGPGIPPENLKRIFDPFFTTKEAGKGTGLGLSICHGIVTEHGGQIYVRSQLGKGATIFVELPIKGRDHIGDMLKTG
jgi:PAS domain S-box-containing protein